MDRPALDFTPIALTTLEHGISALASTASLQWIVTGGADGIVREFDLNRSLKEKQKQFQPHGPLSTVSRGMVEIGSFENDDSVPVFPFVSREEKGSSEDVKEISKNWTNTRLSSVYSLAVEKQALWALTGLKSGNMRLWTMRHETGTCLHLFKGVHKAPVNCIKLVDNEKACITGSWDKQLVKWDLNTGTPIRPFNGHNSQITSVDIHPKNPHVLLSTSFEGAGFVWDVRQAEPLRQLSPTNPNDTPFCFYASWNASGTRIYCGRRDHRVDEYSSDGSHVGNVFKLPVSSGPVSYLLPVEDSHLLSASLDNIRLWEVNSGQYKIIPGHTGGQISGMLMNEKYLVTSSGNRGLGEYRENNQLVVYQRI